MSKASRIQATHSSEVPTQLVAVVVRVIEEPALLNDQAARVDARPVAAIPTERPLAHRGLQRRDGLADVLALLGLSQLVVLDPAPAVAANIEAGGADGLGSRLMPLQCECAAKHRHRQIALLEQSHQTPETDPAAVFEHALASEVAALDALTEAVRLREANLCEAFAVLH
jgi:hypothetical protein